LLVVVEEGVITLVQEAEQAVIFLALQLLQAQQHTQLLLALVEQEGLQVLTQQHQTELILLHLVKQQ
jgi:hypothetical protein